MPDSRAMSCPAVVAWLLASSLGLGVLSAQAHPSPRGIVEIDWPMENISRTLSAGYPDSLGLYALPRNGLPKLEQIEGHACIVGSFFAFDVDDSFAFDIDEEVELEITVDARTVKSVIYSYDKNGVGEATRIELPSQTEGRLHRKRIRLERARFANRGMSGSDIALVASGAIFSIDEGAPNTITLCSITLRRSHETPVPTEFGDIEITVLDERTATPTPARLGLYDVTGRMPLPSADALTISFYNDQTKQIRLGGSFGPGSSWPVENRHAFYTDGRYRARLPSGTYQLVVAKGLEYRIVKRTFEVEAGGAVELRVIATRWDDMPASNWYSGDAHIHITRPRSAIERISAFLQAEDVHISNILEMTNPGAAHFQQYAWGPAGQERTGDHVMVPGIEGPRTAPVGHTISLNISKPLYDREQYFLYHTFFEEYARQGGLSGYAHIGLDDYNSPGGLALDVPFGLVDFLEILQGGRIHTELWYEFLNLGYQLSPVAGSDFPYYDEPGSVRNYVHVKGDFTPPRWFESLESGHTFVTNGPMLTLEVNGKKMGSTVNLRRGDLLSIRATARINPDIDGLDRLELVAHGGVVRSVEAEAGELSLDLDHELTAERGLWLAARAYGQFRTVAHSAPVYVTVDDTGSWHAEEVPLLVQKMQDRLEAMVGTTPRATLELEFWEVGEDFSDLWAQQKPRLQERIRDANRKYDDLLKQVRASLEN